MTYATIKLIFAIIATIVTTVIIVIAITAKDIAVVIPQSFVSDIMVPIIIDAFAFVIAFITAIKFIEVITVFIKVNFQELDDATPTSSIN